MSFETLSYEIDGKKIRIGINRPKAVNAVNGQMKSDLVAAFKQAAEDVKEKDCRVVILFAHGKNFTSGVDLKDMAEKGWEHTPKGWAGHFDELIAGNRAIWDLPVPVIASVRGYALGGGLDLCLMCDYVLCTESARFGAPEIMMGAFAPTLICPWVVGMKKAREILALGVEMSAQEALQMGMVNRVLPDDKLDEEVEIWADHICNIPPEAARMAKKVINMQYEMMGFWESIAYNRDQSIILNLNKTREERAEALRFIREEGLKALLTKLQSITLIKSN